MFRSKRINSGDFEIINTDTNKENERPRAQADMPGQSGKLQAPLQKSRFNTVTPLFGSLAADSGKKDSATRKGGSQGLQHQTERDVVVENGVTHRAFDKMLDELQIPPTLRPKLQSLETPVKAAMVRSSHVLTVPTPPQTPIASITPTKTIRRSQSSGSLQSPPPLLFESSTSLTRPGTPVFQPPKPAFAYGHARGSSLDLLNGKATNSSRVFNSNGPAKLTKEKGAPATHARDWPAGRFSAMLANTKSTELDVERLKKLRIMLRNEAASWSETFLIEGGYSSLLIRLDEMLEVEWREEQRDDHILHELLRCFKALSTSSIGCFALRSSCPRPFVQLVSLLYSDKKPGDVCTRQLIVDLLLTLCDLYPMDVSATGVVPPALPAPHYSLFALLQAILLTPKPPPSESPSQPISPHAFIESLRQPRIFKNYLSELSDVCRDYFWVFCHPGNTIWNLEDTQLDKVEAPKAPGGMTGGVEFEAMAYLTSHFRLVNAMGKAVAALRRPPQDPHSAFKYHQDLFLSGIERIIMISRKASTAYYPTLHLEIARYVASALEAGIELPVNLKRLVGLPPAGVCKPGRVPQGPRPKSADLARSERPHGAAPPVLPPPQRFEEIKF